MVFVLPTGFAHGAAPSPAASSSATWAYGAVTSVNFSGTSRQGVPYVGSATDGYTVEIVQTNLSSSEFELTVNRTAGASFSIKYCSPNCRLSTYYATLEARYWETESSAAYLVSDGSVVGASGAVPAIALLNETTYETANETQATSTFLPVAGSGATLRGTSLAASLAADSSVTFGSPLGLFPLNLSSSQSWTSTANFSALAEATYSFTAARSGGASWSASGSGTFPVQANGSVTVTGAYSSADSITLGGARYPEVALSTQGPFALDEGVILVPVVADLLTPGSSQPWAVNASGAASSTMSYVDATAHIGDHFGLGASRWVYDAQAIEPAASSSSPAGSGVSDLASGTGPDSAPSTVVQGQPQTPTESEATQNCLLSGSACPASGSGSPMGSPRGLLGLVVVGGALAAVLAATVVIAQRRRMPPPVYRNASLYPPGASAPSGVPEPEPAPSPEDDPLGNLW